MSDEKMNAQPEALPLKMDVSARLIEPKGNLLGFADVYFNGAFTVKDFRILQSKDGGLFVGMPSRPDTRSQSGYTDMIYGTKEFRNALNTAVEAAYHAKVEKLQAHMTAIAPQEKPSITKQLANAAEQAEKANVARRLTVAKGSRTKKAER